MKTGSTLTEIKMKFFLPCTQGSNDDWYVLELEDIVKLGNGALLWFFLWTATINSVFLAKTRPWAALQPITIQSAFKYREEIWPELRLSGNISGTNSTNEMIMFKPRHGKVNIRVRATVWKKARLLDILLKERRPEILNLGLKCFHTRVFCLGNYSTSSNQCHTPQIG